MCAEAVMLASVERLGAESPAALMACDTYLARSVLAELLAPTYATEMWVCGSNTFGQLGTGDFMPRGDYVEIPAMHGRRIRAVASGGLHTMVVVDGGDVWGTGMNCSGQLGTGDDQNQCAFRPVPALSRLHVEAVACGDYHTVAMLFTGELFAWGWNALGQLGVGDTESRSVPTRVALSIGGDGGGDRCAMAIACGDLHTAAILRGGELFTWGGNDDGRLGLGDRVFRHTPEQVTALAGSHVAAVACHTNTTAAVLQTGELFVWGGRSFAYPRYASARTAYFGDHDPEDDDERHPLPYVPQKMVELLGCQNPSVRIVAVGTHKFRALLETGSVVEYVFRDSGTRCTGFGIESVLSDGGSLFAHGWRGCDSVTQIQYGKGELTAMVTTDGSVSISNMPTFNKQTHVQAVALTLDGAVIIAKQ